VVIKNHSISFSNKVFDKLVNNSNNSNVNLIDFKIFKLFRKSESSTKTEVSRGLNDQNYSLSDMMSNNVKFFDDKIFQLDVSCFKSRNGIQKKFKYLYIKMKNTGSPGSLIM
jgi:hypothetical protein